MLTVFYRAIIVYVLVFVAIRLSGKRQLSQLQPFDLVITLLIADLASEPVSDPDMSLLYGVIPIAALFLMQKLLAFFALKSERIRSFACGKPLVIIGQGHIYEDTMRRACYTMQDLLEHLRTKSVFDISQVEYAILETCGDLSVLLKSDFQNATCSDLNISNPDPVPSYALIIDGNIMNRSMNDAHITKDTLLRHLSSIGISDIKSLLYAILSDEATLRIQLKASCGGAEYAINISDTAPCTPSDFNKNTYTSPSYKPDYSKHNKTHDKG